MTTLVIAGAGPGLGLSIAEKFGEKEIEVALIARNQSKLDDYVSSLVEKGIVASGFAADVTNKQQMKDAFSKIKETYGQIDILIYNAGVIEPVSAVDTTDEVANQHLQVNVIGGITSAQLVLPDMIDSGQGTILFTGGGGSELTVTPILTTLSIGKSGLRSYAHCLHAELADKGIYVGMLSIDGIIKEGTYFSPDNIADEYVDMYRKRDSVERFYTDKKEDTASVLKDTYSG